MGRILQRIRKTLLRVADLAANKGKTPDVYPWSWHKKCVSLKGNFINEKAEIIKVVRNLQGQIQPIK